LGQLVAAVAAAVFAFWPQGGILGRDLTLVNSVDLDPAAGATLDPWCGTKTYDTHTGEDVTYRSFREIKIGVPVFSLTDGTVSEVQDGLNDFRFGPNLGPRFDNHLVVDTADGRRFVYGHLRHNLTLRRGDVVQAGQQIAWSASSGNSAWPHLHLTELVNGEPHDLFRGPCNPGPGDAFAIADPFSHAPYLRLLTVSAKPYAGQAALPYDEARRTGTFVRGVRDVWLRLELGGDASGVPTIQIGDRVDAAPVLRDGGYPGTYVVRERVRFDRLGAWPLRITLGDTVLAEASLRVVATASQVVNRPPFPVTTSVTVAGGIAQCVVQGSLAVRDPDFDLVAYRYRWTANGAAIRTVTSAMSSDLVRVPAGTTPACSVTTADVR
jgi:hypothetical protein